MGERTKILLNGFWDNQVADLARRFPAVDFVAAEGDLAGHRADALVSLTQSALDELFRPDVLDRCDSLRWVHASQAGIDDYLPHLPGIRFTFTCGKVICGPNVADHGMALLLALTRRLPWVLKGVPPGKAPRPTELYGKRAVVVGLGGIGMLLAERCAAFGMGVEAVTQVLMPMVSFIGRVWRPDQLLDALAGADVVLVAAPGTHAAKGLIGRDALAAMKDDAYLINVSRGTLVDIDALTEAVAAGRLAGVGLDVTDPEPLPDDHPLFKAERVLVTPHYAGMTTSHARRFELIEHNIHLFLRGEPLLNVVDPKLGY